MVPKESGFNLPETSSCLWAHRVWRFLCSPAMARDGEIIQMQHFCHYGNTICHPISYYVTTKLHGTSRVYCGCKNNAIFSDSYFHVSYHRRMPAMLIWSRQSIGGSCQNGEMATLLNSLSLSFVFKISFLPKYRVIYLYCKVVQWDIMQLVCIAGYCINVSFKVQPQKVSNVA